MSKEEKRFRFLFILFGVLTGLRFFRQNMVVDGWVFVFLTVTVVVFVLGMIQVWYDNTHRHD